jgi:hypothetical protein
VGLLPYSIGPHPEELAPASVSKDEAPARDGRLSTVIAGLDRHIKPEDDKPRVKKI